LFAFFGVVKVFRVFGGSGSFCDVPLPFDLFVVCTTAYSRFVILFVCWFSGEQITFASRSGVGV